MPGALALVGGGEFTEGCSFDAGLVERSGASEVLVLPTGAAYEHPDRLVERAADWFDRLGVPARGLPVLARPDALSAANVDEVRRARFLYLVGGSPMHVRSVLKDTPVWDALAEAWDDGATLAGSSAGAMVMCDPMVDPRGGAFTLGLGLVNLLTVIPHADAWSPEKAQRTFSLAPAGVAVVALPEQTAIVRRPEDGGQWAAAGLAADAVTAWQDGHQVDIASLTA